MSVSHDAHFKMRKVQWITFDSIPAHAFTCFHLVQQHLNNFKILTFEISPFLGFQRRAGLYFSNSSNWPPLEGMCHMHISTVTRVIVACLLVLLFVYLEHFAIHVNPFLSTSTQAIGDDSFDVRQRYTYLCFAAIHIRYHSISHTICETRAQKNLTHPQKLLTHNPQPPASRMSSCTNTFTQTIFIAESWQNSIRLMRCVIPCHHTQLLFVCGQLK